jgi:hypothetical protein
VVGPVPTAALQAIGGRGPVGWARFADASGAPRRERVEVVAFGDRTPNLDLVLAAGARVAWRDGRLAPVVDPDGGTSVPGLFVAGDAAGPATGPEGSDAFAGRAGDAAGRFAREATSKLGRSAGNGARRPGDPPRSTTDAVAARVGTGAAHAVLCFCEDVRGWEIQAEQAAGYADPELVKRRTGALTGPCQGKFCLSAVTCALSGPDTGPTTGIVLPTSRPPLRPIRLGDLVAEEAPAGSDSP